MRGKKAKRLRKLAYLLLHSKKINPAEGKNEYNQAMNTVIWDNFIDEETGVLAKDPDGGLLLKPRRNPGTIRHAHKKKIAYSLLKKLSKKGQL